MGYNTLALGLTLTIPTSGTRNWGSQLYNTTWTKISSHDHTGGGNGNQIGTTAIADNSIIASKIPDRGITSVKLQKNLSLSQYAYTATGASPTVALDFDNGNIFTIDASGASGTVTVNLSNPQAGALYRIYLTNPAVLTTLAFGSTIKWPQGQAPILTASGIDKLELYYDGTNYLGDWEPNYV